MFTYKTWILIIAVVISVSGPVQGKADEEKSRADSEDKITFNLNQLNDQGLYGPPGGLRALSYEFCIPADSRLANQVKAIDPTVVIYSNSKGRSRCSGYKYLCIGNTHQPEFRAVLLNLAGLPFVKRINQCFFE